MTVEELLKPRYKVIADYPNSLFEAGEVLTKIEGISVYSTGRVGIDAYDVSHYPHLFRKLEWWEERQPEDMPEYVKGKINGKKVFKVSGFGPTSSGTLHIGWMDEKKGLIAQAAKALLPATEAEYLTFKNLNQ
jgi:hypothetical protein